MNFITGRAKYKQRRIFSLTIKKDKSTYINRKTQVFHSSYLQLQVKLLHNININNYGPNFSHRLTKQITLHVQVIKPWGESISATKWLNIS